MSTWPAAIFFDFDGVIVNSEPLHLRGFQEVLAAEGIELSEREYFRELIGFDDRNAFLHIFKLRGRPLDPLTFERVLARKRDFVQTLVDRGEFGALPGADELVRELSAHYPLAICSGALRSEIETMLDGLKLRERFPVIVAAEDVVVGKPDPSCYLLTMRLVGERIGRALTPADCLIIEDAPTVIRSTRAVGFKTLGVATSYPLEELSHADFAVTSLRPAEVVAKIPQLKVSP